VVARVITWSKLPQLPQNSLALKHYRLYLALDENSKKYVLISAISPNSKNNNITCQVKTGEHAGGMPRHARHE
jgi:PhoPQ-activated pathogenicity-related protein